MTEKEREKSGWRSLRRFAKNTPSKTKSYDRRHKISEFKYQRMWKRQLKSARHGEAVVLKINARQMVEDGYVFLLSANGVWQTERVPVKYITYESV